jgi:acyl phosphate:glycerol-3-phosphate acyltransferase
VIVPAVSVITGYLIGSVPTAYIFVRLFAQTDIRHGGSGNVGATNVYKVTNSRFLSILVGVIDVLKGTAAFYAGYLIGGGFVAGAAAGIGAVAGHNYPVWLGFRGGRGLATAAGVFLPWAWFAPVAWALLWGMFRTITGNTHVSNVIATAILVIAILIARSDWLYAVTGGAQDAGSMRIATAVLGMLVILRHGTVLRSVSDAIR